MSINPLKPSISSNETMRSFQADIVKTMQHDSINGELVTHDEMNDIFSVVENNSDLSFQEKASLAQEAYQMTASRQGFGAGNYLQNFVKSQLLKDSIATGAHSLSADEDMVGVTFSNLEQISGSLSSVSSELLTYGAEISRTGQGGYEDHLISVNDMQDVRNYMGFVGDTMENIKKILDVQYQAAASTEESSIHDNVDQIIELYQTCDQVINKVNLLVKKLEVSSQGGIAVVNKIEISNEIDMMLADMEKAKSVVLDIITE